MPEQQASPTSSQPRATSVDDSDESNDIPLSVDAAQLKRTYLSLLPPSQLIDLLLAIDVDRQTLIFPDNLQSAVEVLKRPTPSPAELERQPPSSQVPSLPKPPDATSVLVKAESTPGIIPAPPSTQDAVQPPQYKPPPHKIPPHMYPYTHTPYYAQIPSPNPSHTSVPAVPPPAAPPRHPLFTTTPLTRDLNKSTVVPTPPPPVVSSRNDPNAMPSYEEMIVEAIMDVGEHDGTAPKVLFAWMASHYPLQQNFRPSASQALHKALKRGRLEKIGGKYRLNPSWGGGPTISKRATRRPTANRPTSPSASSPSLTPGQPFPLPQPPPNAVAAAIPKADEMDEDEVESEDVEITDAVEEGVADSSQIKERIKQSLIRLATVLKRFAKKGEGTEVEEDGDI
ncbi:hypothetical protein BU17DRAFT_61604 [Hysterangium stoloniferum]|nr:hypothetical protein BU17DRAFT_61604 [Hysterangium stoloniferum]